MRMESHKRRVIRTADAQTRLGPGRGGTGNMAKKERIVETGAYP